MRPVTSKLNALAGVALDALSADSDPLFPCTPEEYVMGRELSAEHREAILRGLKRPEDLRAWAEGVRKQWKRQYEDFIAEQQRRYG